MEAWAEHASGPPSQLGAERWEWSDGAPSAGQAVDDEIMDTIQTDRRAQARPEA